MGKIRTVKPDLLRHERLFEAEQSSGFPLRLIFIGLFTAVDAAGRFRWRPRQLKLDILPYDQTNFTEALSALADFGFVIRYEYGGEYYGYIPTWRKHQNINPRESKSILPDPQQGFILKPPTAHGRVDLSSTREWDQTMQVPVTHRSASAPPTSSSDAFSEPETPVTASSAVAEPRICMHMQDVATSVPSTVEHLHAPLEMEVEMEKELELEVEKEGKGKNSPHPHTRAVPHLVESVFEHWRQVMDHPKAVLDKQRRRYIRLALEMGYSAEDLCLAITGCSLTPHNCGHNDRGERYDGLHVILRSSDQIDRFIRNAQHPPRPLNPAEQRLNSNVQAAQEWLHQQQETSDDSHAQN